MLILAGVIDNDIYFDIMGEYPNTIRYGARNVTRIVLTRSTRPKLLQHPVRIKLWCI